jgi:hypothetical protein
MKYPTGIVPLQRLWLTVFALLAVVAFRFWIMPLHSSLWLDETGTYWTAKDALSKAMERIFEAQVSSSPIHSVIESAFIKLPVSSPEIALRIPSVAAIMISIWLVYRLG